MYRVIPPEGLALPDIHETKAQAHEFFRMHYAKDATEHNFNWYWLEQVRPLRYGDFIVSSVLAGVMKERMADLGIDDSAMPDDLADTLEALARHIINEYTEEMGFEVPGWVVEERSRVESAD